MTVEHTTLSVTEVTFDPKNPRIALFLESYDHVEPAFVQFALQPSDAKYNELRQAIKTNEGIINPIIVNKVNGSYIAIEGNTRLAIYKEFHQDNPDDETWQRIPAIVYEDMRKEVIDAIRLQAHLVGVRNWSPYAKARYLYELHENESMPLSALVDFCGGRKLEVLRNIQAYREMNCIYRPLIPEDEFSEHKFSLFYEGTKMKVRESLTKAGFTIQNFTEWVRDGKFEPRQELVRSLPQILSNSRAREVFLSQGAAEAEKYIDRPELDQELRNASLAELCRAIAAKVEDMTLRERDELRKSEDTIQELEDASVGLASFLENEIQDA